MGSMRVREVFVAGGQPEATYVERQQFNLEARVAEYLEELHKVLSISGPTKSGKTVLVRKLLPRGEALWVSGGQIESAEDFWEIINEEFATPQVFSQKTAASQSHVEARTLDATIKPGGMGGSVASNVSGTQQSSTENSSTWNADPKRAAIRSLSSTKSPLVIDDFHYLERDIQTTIIRSLKDPVFDGLPVVLLSVPHRSYDAVRVEREMTGRLAQIQIHLWDTEELKQIAYKGFEALNLICDDAIISHLALESFGSPHLMQDFCGTLCRINGVSEKAVGEAQEIRAPAEWQKFFKSRASEASKTAFDRLAMGPRQRTERMQRETHTGDKIDIYKAVLLGIANTGPKMQISYEEIRSAIRDVLITPPESHEISRVLDKMTEIARLNIEGEPVVDWDKEYSTLHISDPFFAYYLKWAIRDRIQ